MTIDQILVKGSVKGVGGKALLEKIIQQSSLLAGHRVIVASDEASATKMINEEEERRYMREIKLLMQIKNTTWYNLFLYPEGKVQVPDNYAMLPYIMILGEVRTP